jgi:hypothetical protein
MTMITAIAVPALLVSNHLTPSTLPLASELRDTVIL